MTLFAAQVKVSVVPQMADKIGDQGQSGLKTPLFDLLTSLSPPQAFPSLMAMIRGP